jgi:ATP/maltotriose-dependent transcriptional regulator MalT
MLVGEPGIGKTRTAEEFAAYAREQGDVVLWGRCHEQQGMPPFWPWVQAIRSYVRASAPEDVRSDMGAGVSVIAEIVPDVNEALPDLKPPSELESPEQARFRLFDAITTFLKNISTQAKALALVLDDLHWADEPSLLLLEFLSQELSNSNLMVIGTYRDVDLSRQHPLTETLGQLNRGRLFQRVPLRGLSLEAEGQLIQATSGAQPDQEFVGLVHSRTEGNPLFISEVVRMLEQEGSIDWQDAEVRIPEGVREVIGRRLNRLTKQCNRALTVASVIGRNFGLDQLDLLIKDTSQDRLLDVLDEAQSARIIDELPEAAGRYQFTHSLIQQTLAEELSLTRRTRLHARIAESLEELYGAGAEAHASELAHHFAQAETVLGTKKLSLYSTIAGEQAIGSNAYQEALVHFQTALAAKENPTHSMNADQGADAQTATILFGLARAQAAIFATAQGQEAVDTLRRSFDAFVALGDTKHAVAVASYPHTLRAVTSGAADMAARALDLVAPDSHEAGYLLSRYGAALSFEKDDYEGAQKNLDLAVEIARREGDRTLEIRSLYPSARMHFVQGQYEEAIEKLHPVIELAQSLDELFLLILARNICANALLAMAEGDEARAHARAGLELAERSHNRGLLVLILRTNASLAMVKGEWNSAQEFIDRGLAESPSDAYTLMLSAMLNLQLGNFEESNKFIEQILEAVPDSLVGIGLEHAGAAAAIPLFARVTGITDQLDVAVSAAREVLSVPTTANNVTYRARVGLGLIAIQRGDVESANEQYSFLKSERGTQPPFQTFCADRILGLLARTIGNQDDAFAHFENALAFCRKADYRPELAWTLHDYADMLMQRNSSDDISKARELADESDQVASDLVMKPLSEKVTSLKELLDAQPTPRPQYPDGLTEREVEVLRLVAAGLSNREIGEELFISVNTVARHVNHIFSKIDASNRAEAATYANQKGIVQPGS